MLAAEHLIHQRLELLPAPVAQQPWRHLPLWLAIGFAVRALVALGGDFVLHPDEIMQHLEPAHKVVFGHGVVYWEFFVGARNWIVPGFVASILWLLDLVGLGEPHIYVYVVKLAFCALSLLVPWGVYNFTRGIADEQSARAALILACLWPYIAIFAHKPFTEFVATSLFFAALGLLGRADGRSLIIALGFGALLGAVAAIRMHYIPAAGLLWLAAAVVLGRRFAIYSSLAGFAVVLAAGLLDFLTWGHFFQSYLLNFAVNLELDTYRTAQEWYFYLIRLVYVSAGGVIIAIWAVMDRPKSFGLIAMLFCVILIAHSLVPHKELRFVSILHGLWIIPMASFLTELFKGARESKALAGFAMAGAFAFALVASGALNDQWLHKAHSNERGDFNYLFNQSNIFDVFLELAADPNLRGVSHVSDPYFNTPGYYYLHQEVPFYDQFTVPAAITSIDGDLELAQNLFSHVISTHNLPPLPNFLPVKTSGEYRMSATSANNPVNTKQLKSYSPVQIGESTFKLVNEFFSIPYPPVFPDYSK